MTLEELKKKKVSAISLGCDKNRVDLEKMLYNLKNFGFTITENIADCDILIVNTCAFISPAIKESIENIFLALSQKENKCEKVIVTGCLNNRFPDEVKNLFKDVDCIVSIKDNDQIVNKIMSLYNVEGKYSYKNGRLLTNMPHYAYLKIADGCDNGCAYCTIPRIRGRYKSEPMDILIKEAKDLAEQGVKEIILVAQDITRYMRIVAGGGGLCSALSVLAAVLGMAGALIRRFFLVRTLFVLKLVALGSLRLRLVAHVIKGVQKYLKMRISRKMRV